METGDVCVYSLARRCGCRGSLRPGLCLNGNLVYSCGMRRAGFEAAAHGGGTVTGMVAGAQALGLPGEAQHEGATRVRRLNTPMVLEKANSEAHR